MYLLLNWCKFFNQPFGGFCFCSFPFSPFAKVICFLKGYNSSKNQYRHLSQTWGVLCIEQNKSILKNLIKICYSSPLSQLKVIIAVFKNSLSILKKLKFVSSLTYNFLFFHSHLNIL